MPPDLTSVLRTELEARGRFEEACGPNVSDKDLIGGEEVEEALLHFIHRFKTSSARTQYVTMSPCGTFKEVSANFLEFLFDGKVSILDIPCGSGGGLLGLLCTVSELRRQGKRPHLPVDLTIISGDISKESMRIHESMLKGLRPALESVGIRVQTKYYDWDVCDPFSSSRLVDKWLQQCPNDDEYLIFVSAFSGFAGDHLEIVQRAIDQIMSRFYDKICLLAWIEPGMRVSTKTLKRLTEWVFKWFSSYFPLKSSVAEKEYFFKHPFLDEKIRGHAQVRLFRKEVR